MTCFPTPNVSLAAVMEHRRQYRVLLLVVTTIIVASSDIMCAPVVSRQVVSLNVPIINECDIYKINALSIGQT